MIWSLYRKKEIEMKSVKDSYDKCTIKEKIAIITAVAAFVLGWALTIAGFIVPPIGDISNSVLWVLGQALIYAASVFGITSYFKSESVQMKNDMQRYFNKQERLLLERERIRNGNDTGEIPINDEDDE